MVKILYVSDLNGVRTVLKEEEWYLGKQCRPPSPLSFDNHKFVCSTQDDQGNWMYLRKEKS